MADIFSPEKRSEIMSHVRSKGTGAEKLAFSYLRKNKIYFQKHYGRAPGKPDIALPRKKKAVFIDSAFWHGKTLEKIARSRAPDDYWVKKISGNIARDAKQRNTLRDNGWQVLVIWEDDIKRKKTREVNLRAIKEFLSP